MMVGGGKDRCVESLEPPLVMELRLATTSDEVIEEEKRSTTLEQVVLTVILFSAMTLILVAM